MTIAIAVLVAIIIIILAVVIGYIVNRRRRQARLNHQNQRPVETQRNNLHKIDENKIDNQKVTASAPFYVSSPTSKTFPTIVEIGRSRTSDADSIPNSVCSKESCCQASLCDECKTYNHNLKLHKPGTSPDKSNYLFI